MSAQNPVYPNGLAYDNSMYNQLTYGLPGGGIPGAGAPYSQAASNLFSLYNTTASNPAGGSSAGSYTAGGYGASYGGVPSYGSTSTASPGATGFTLNPAPTQGSGTTFGMVPGAIGAPPSVWQQEQSIPGVGAATSSETSLINSQLAGQLSPSTTANLENSAASRGFSLGQGGNTGLTNEILMNTLGLSQEQLQQQGSQNYLNFLTTTGQQQQSPQLLADIASRNAAMAAAPNPTLAAQEAIALGQGSGRTTNPGYQTTPTYGTGTTNYYDFGGDTGTPSQTPQISYNQPTTGQFDYLTGGQGPVTSATAATGQQDAYSQLQNILTGGDFSYLNPAS